MSPESLARDKGRPVSLNDFLEQFQSMATERREMAGRLSQALDEIENLRAQFGSRLDSLLATKERLMREEFERKYQDLVVEVRREHTRHGQEIKELKEQLSGCICDRPKKTDLAFWNSRRQRLK